MVRANNYLVGVNQNFKSFNTMLEGLVGMNSQVETLTGGKGSDVVSNSLRQALERSAAHYNKVVEDKIHYEAGMNRSLDHYLRHLYRGGNPENMGEEDKKLFTVNYREIKGSGGYGWQTYISTITDGSPSVSWITGSDRRLTTDTNGEIIFSNDKYPAWRERAAFVYKMGGTASGNRTTEGPKYLAAAGPEPADGGAASPPEWFAATEQFTEDYSSHKIWFKKWWENELKVSAEQMVDSYDASFRDGGRKTLYKLWQYAKAEDAKMAARAGAGAKTPTTFLTGRAKSASSSEMIPVGAGAVESTLPMAKKIARMFYTEFSKALERNEKRVTAMPSKPMPEQKKVVGNKSKTMSERAWREEQERRDRERWLK